MYEAEPVISSFFFVSFMIIVTIAFLNMIIAIIVAHYNEYMKEIASDEESSLNFYQIVRGILKEHWMIETEE